MNSMPPAKTCFCRGPFDTLSAGRYVIDEAAFRQQQGKICSSIVMPGAPRFGHFRPAVYPPILDIRRRRGDPARKRDYSGNHLNEVLHEGLSDGVYRNFFPGSDGWFER